MALMRPLTRVKSDLNSIFDEMDTMLKPFMLTRHPEIQEHLNSWYPSIDVIEHDNRLEIRAAIPGYEPDQIDVEVDHNTITISGENYSTNEVKEGSKYLHQEMVTGRFSRKLQLPYDVLSEEAKAEFKHGVLLITLPKAAQSKKLKIEIN